MSLALLDWRRRVANLYAEVRAEPDVVAAHDHWRRTRDDLLRTHPESPVPQAQRARYPGAPVAAYDPRLRFDATLDTDVPPKRMDVRTGTDGIVSFGRIGCVHLPGGDLDVWWLGCYGGGIFIPVKDGSAGSATYGGGRYLIDTVKGADLRVQVGDPAAPVEQSQGHARTSAFLRRAVPLCTAIPGCRWPAGAAPTGVRRRW